MSWGIKIVGKPANVLAVVNSNPDLPQGLKDAIKAVADQVGPDDFANGVFVETYGHIGGANSNAKFTCEPIALAPCVAQYASEPEMESPILHIREPENPPNAAPAEQGKPQETPPDAAA